MRRTSIAAILLVTGGLVPSVTAQEIEFRAVTNPFQEGFTYRIGENLAPNVDVDGVRWTLVRIDTKSKKEISPKKDVSITLEVELDNRREDTVEVLVALMLENARGDSLERLASNMIRLDAGELRQARSKFRVPGDALLSTRGLYLFCELQE